jgi:hypothetical protein
MKEFGSRRGVVVVGEGPKVQDLQPPRTASSTTTTTATLSEGARQPGPALLGSKEDEAQQSEERSEGLGSSDSVEMTYFIQL